MKTKNKRTSEDALNVLRQTNFSEMLYRGYFVKRNWMNEFMWIEKDGFCIHRLNTNESWNAARTVIDSLIDLQGEK